MRGVPRDWSFFQGLDAVQIGGVLQYFLGVGGFLSSAQVLRGTLPGLQMVRVLKFTTRSESTSAQSFTIANPCADTIFPWVFQAFSLSKVFLVRLGPLVTPHPGKRGRALHSTLAHYLHENATYLECDRRLKFIQYRTGIGAFLQAPAPVLDKISGSMGATIFIQYWAPVWKPHRERQRERERAILPGTG